MAKLRLHQFLSKTGIFSGKKDVMSAIESGEISIDGDMIMNPQYQFNPNTRKAEYKGKEISLHDEKLYLIFNKPKGYLSTKLTKKDKKLEKKTMFDLIDVDDKVKNTLFAVGRLDEDSSGLIIITNDGKLGIRIARPGRVKKTYHVVLEKPFQEKEKVEQGIDIILEKNGRTSIYKTMPCSITMISDTELEISLSEGKKREVRRIFEAVGNSVLGLERSAIGELKLSDTGLKPGEYKKITKDSLSAKIFN